MNKKFVLLSLREDWSKKRKEINYSVDHKLILWIEKVGLSPILISNLSSVNFNKFNAVGVILSGGGGIDPKSSRYKTEKKLVNWAKLKKKPILGICHGLQFLAYLDGAKFRKISGHVRKRHKIISVKKDYIFPKIVNSYHNYSISTCPKNYEVTAYSNDRVIEGLRHKKLNWEGWMWHPERDKNFNLNLITKARKLFKVL